MFYLLIASFLWAFSFGLIGSALRGVDVPSVVLVRLVLAWLLFLPFGFARGGTARPFARSCGLFVIGAVQFGLMYVFYMSSFRFLQGHQVALMTAFTPLIVAGLCARGRPWRQLLVWVVACGLALVGAALTVSDWSLVGGSLTGVVLIQLSNLCFAAGQVAYRGWLSSERVGEAAGDARSFPLMYSGGVAVAASWALVEGAPVSLLVALGPGQWLALVYLGLVPAGLGFFLWNVGARRAAPGVLAVMNNVKIPLAVLLSVALFREEADLGRVVASTLLMVAAVAVALASWTPPKMRGASWGRDYRDDPEPRDTIAAASLPLNSAVSEDEMDQAPAERVHVSG